MMNSDDLLKIQGDISDGVSLGSQTASGKSAATGGGPKINLADMGRLALKRWYWFAGCLVVCLGVAWFLLKKAAPVYTRTASVLIKDKKSGGRVGSESAVFQEVKFLGAEASVDNEMLIFKTERLNQEVVRRLNLNVLYQEDGGFRMVDLYGQEPVDVTFAPQDSLRYGSFVVELLPQQKVVLKDFSGAPEARVEGRLNTSLQTPLGRVQVVPTLFYKQGAAGREMVVTKMPVATVARAYATRLVTDLAQKESSVVNLTLNDVSPQRAEDYLNTLVEVYKEDMIQDKNQVALSTDRFITERLQVLEQDLGGVDGKIASFKQQNRMTDLKSEAGLATGNTDKYQQEGFGLESQLQLVQFIRKYLTDPAKQGDLIPSNTGVADVNIESQIGEYNKLLLERDKLLQNSGSENPVVAEMSRTLEVTRKAIMRTVDNTITSLQMRLRNVQHLEAQTAQRVNAVPAHEKFMLSVERQQKVKEQLYVYLLQKREENALAQSITESNARLIEAAKGPAGPISPMGSQYYLIAVVLGLGLPAAVIVLICMLDTKVHSRKDVEELLTVPFLGDIPLCEPGVNPDKEPVVKADGTDQVTEAFRMLRTNIHFLNRTHETHRVAMVTSMNPGAGKTFLSGNLAASLAYAGKKVLLIDLDIRRRALTKMVGGKRNKGVTNYLGGDVTEVASLIQSVPQVPGLDIIFSGPIPPNPAELLLGESLDRLIGEVKASYDWVIVDNAPCGMVADAVIANRLADFTFFVLRAGLMDKRQMPDIQQFYDSKKLKNMALVLNGVHADHAGYGYYGYSKGYGYGYHQQKKSKKGFLKK